MVQSFFVETANLKVFSEAQLQGLENCVTNVMGSFYS